MAKSINGKLLAQNILRKIKKDINFLKVENEHFKPKLSVLQIYQALKNLNEDDKTHGIIIQLPLDSTRSFKLYDLINQINPIKDVDGLTATNTARLSRGDYHLKDPFNSPLLHIPCCALACLEMAKYTGRELRGARCVIVGHGRLVGAPLADLLLWSADATVTTCHAYTRDLPAEVQKADFVVSAVGQRNLIRGEWLKPGAVVIDGGISCVRRGDLPPEERGKNGDPEDLVTCGDVEFKEAQQRAGWISPVPGGVGPLTVAMLMHNTYKAACQQVLGIKASRS